MTHAYYQNWESAWKDWEKTEKIQLVQPVSGQKFEPRTF